VTRCSGGRRTKAKLQRVPDEINLTAGFALQAHPRVTLVADAIGRLLRNVGRFGQGDETLQYRLTTGGPITSQTFSDSTTVSQGDLFLGLGAAGARINVAGTLLLNFSVLFPLTDSGLKPGISLAGGLEVTF
jgi:hypothetical protein